MKFAPLAAAISASLLVSACVDLGDDNDNDDKGVSYQATATLGTITNGVGDYTVKVTASDGSDLEGASISVQPVMDMGSDGSIDHGTPVSRTEGELDENGEFKATGYFLMKSGEMGSWFLEVSNEEEGLTQTLPITVNWDQGGHAKLSGGSADQIMSMNGGTTDRTYYVFSEHVMEHAGMNMTVVNLHVAARESMMDYNAVGYGETLKGGSRDLSIKSVKLEACASDCMTTVDNNMVMNMDNWLTVENFYNGVVELEFDTTGISSLMVKLTVNDVVKTSTDGSSMHTTLLLTGSSDMSDMDHSHAGHSDMDHSH